MHLLNNGSQVEQIPAIKSREGIGGYFSESNDDDAPSYPGADWFNAVIREFQNALAVSGVAFNPDSFNHLAALIQITAVPVGSPMPWFTDTAPNGHAIFKGQAFDKDANPQLALIFPTGVLLDLRGVGLIGKEEGETVGAFAEGQVKSHGHDGSSVSSTNLGRKYTNTTGHHPHTQLIYRGNDLNWSSSFGGPYPVGTDDQSGAHRTGHIDGNGNHHHYTDIGVHGHNVTIALNGALKNTIDHYKVNWITRMA
ncbi:phage tail protein [Enterovibrio norvegicus]|uniref:phage tail protein n=1 Tax=Enterovibrio norvegicus TaxID=188144 RepID=UPI0024B08CA1|nr:phage tail protein [Enterovibrio norvegicus]